MKLLITQIPIEIQIIQIKKSNHLTEICQAL